MKWACLSLAVLVLTLAPLGGAARSSDQQPVVETESRLDSTVIVNVINVPARAVVCGLNVWLASIFMTASGGMRYGDAAEMMEQGCSGPWVITREMIDQGRPPRKEARSVVWEIDHLR